MEDVKKLLESLKDLESKADKGKGKLQLLKASLKEEFGIKPTEIAEQQKILQEKRNKAIKNVQKWKKRLQKEWLEVFGKEGPECPI